MTDLEDAIVAPLPAIRKVDRDQPWIWLAAGWRDLRKAGGVSLAYGAFYAVLGFALTTYLWLSDVLYISLPLAAMFTLIGPLLAVGLYQISRDLDDGRPISLLRSLTAWRANPGQIAFMGVVLLLFALAWMRLAFLIFMLFFGHAPMGPEALLMIDRFLAVDSIPFLIVGTSVGAVLAMIVFTISVVALPMLLDDPDSNVITAIATSVNAVRKNFWTMALWAWLIAVFIGVGLLTAYIGLIVTLPLIGHATWHAYRDVVVREDGGTIEAQVSVAT